MTSRMHAPHTTCPGCQEEVFLDELVGGKCPLCGCSLEDFDESIGEYEGILDRSDLSWLIFNYFVFKKFVESRGSAFADHGICVQVRAECRQTRRRVDENGVLLGTPDGDFRQDPAQAMCEVQPALCGGRTKTDHR